MNTLLKILCCISFFAVPYSNLYALHQLPENVYLKNSEQGISYEYYYALKDGKIWIKTNESTTGIKDTWKLFDGTGLPHSEDVPSFKSGDIIESFSTDGTMIVAVSQRKRFYFWQPTLQENTLWEDETGSPFEGPLYMPAHKAWCFSFSVLRAPWKRLTPMHDIVTYWEDIDGNKTEFGLTATIYVVGPEGQKIYFTDTGLPTAFNKALTSPDRGRFIIENISASASTLFVINKTGKMYTRMYDAEIEGGGPALMFTYRREKRTSDDQVMPIMNAMRSLPLPDWREQEPITEVYNHSGNAAITSNITILQTGKGNAARELRVQGRNRAGLYGYYYKRIFDQTWKFKVTGTAFDKALIIKNYLKGAPRGRKLDKTYSGSLIQAGVETLKVELLDFYYFSSPATLRIHVKNKDFDMTFHTVDQWTFTTQEKGYPEIVGSPAGEPKLLQGTLEIPRDVLNSRDPDIKETIDRYFARFNLAAFAFSVMADDERVIIKSKSIQRESLQYMDYAFRKRITVDLVNTSPESIIIPKGKYSAMTESAQLSIPKNWNILTKKEIPEIEQLINQNNDVLWEMKKMVIKEKLDHIVTSLMSCIACGIYYGFDIFINIFGLPWYPTFADRPYINETLSEFGGLSYTGGDPLLDFAELNFKLAFRSNPDYSKAKQILLKRMKKLKTLHRNLTINESEK